LLSETLDLLKMTNKQTNKQHLHHLQIDNIKHLTLHTLS